MAALAEKLGATVHDGAGLRLGPADRLLGQVTRMNPLWWAIARGVRRMMQPGDVIFCTGEDVGVPTAVLCGRQGAVTMTVHAADSPKKRLAFRLLGVPSRTAKFFAVAESQVAALRDLHGIDREKTEFIWDQTDTRFFSPAETPPNRRPLVMSIGLERRDYASLATATADLDLDVRISGFSADTRLIEQAFPPQLPANMDRAFYSWPDLQQLYRSADIVVVSLFPNRYAAGVQGLMEGMSTGKPVIVTATEGLRPYLDPEAMRIVPTQEPAALRNAIVELLGDAEGRRRLGRRARELALARHTLEGYLDHLSGALRALERPQGRTGAPAPANAGT